MLDIDLLSTMPSLKMSIFPDVKLEETIIKNKIKKRVMMDTYNVMPSA
jgi:hypothetical protein